MKELAVHRWPGPAPAPQDGLFAILLDTARSTAGGGSANAQRDGARRHLRHATREALAAVLRLPLEDISIASDPGAPPRILLAGRQTGIGCSFTHEGSHSLAAVNLQGSIGADIMRVQDIPDWQMVSHDYLSPAITIAIQALPAAERPRSLAKAWTQREAALKYHAQHLSEWQADLPGLSISLVLPVPGLTGHIHIGDKQA
jgi:4'-phosphopantetheinyl transferase